MLWLVSYYKPYYVVGRYDVVSFPAYALLIGLALGKLSTVPVLGRYVALITFMLLCVPITVKLQSYYSSPLTTYGRYSAQATAQTLDREVADGDLVLFSGIRHAPVLYYLRQLEYRWEGGDCIQPSRQRRFHCINMPQDSSDLAFDLNEPPMRQFSIREVVLRLTQRIRTLTPGATIWVLSDRVRNRAAAETRKAALLMLHEQGYQRRKATPTMSRLGILPLDHTPPQP
jgi:hypothetical protein